MLFRMTAEKKITQGENVVFSTSSCGTSAKGLASHVDDEYGWKEIRLVKQKRYGAQDEVSRLMTQRSSTAVEALNFLNDRLTWERPRFMTMVWQLMVSTSHQITLHLSMLSIN